MAKRVVLYLQMHQPKRVGKLTLFDFKTSQKPEDLDTNIFDQKLNKEVTERVFNNSYKPVLVCLNNLINRYNIKLTLGVSGALISQLNNDELIQLKELVSSKNIDIVNETYYHSLASLSDLEEFKSQIVQHKEEVSTKLSKDVVGLRNTELLTDQALIDFVSGEKLLLLCEENENLTNNPNFLIRNNAISDSIGFRLNELSVVDITSMILKDIQEKVIIGVDFETFGEHYDLKKSLKFIEEFTKSIVEKGGKFLGVSDYKYDDYSKPPQYSGVKSWADISKDDSAWLGNEMQKKSFDRIMKLKDKILAINKPRITDMWRSLQTSDHFYYMSTKQFDDGIVHEYFSPFNTPHDAYVYYNNALTELELFISKN